MSDSVSATSRVEQGDDAFEEVEQSVEAIDGIGPTYAERLYDADIETVDDLVEHSPASLAAATDAPCSRTESWLARADGGTPSSSMDSEQ